MLACGREGVEAALRPEGYTFNLTDLQSQLPQVQTGVRAGRTADRRISMFGTVNLDMRSLWLNYEVALFVYGAEFAEELHALQQSYMDDCECLAPEQWSKRPSSQRFLKNALRLVGPVL